MASSWDLRIDNTKRRIKVLNEFDTSAGQRDWSCMGTQGLAKKPSHGQMRVDLRSKGGRGRGGWRLPAFNELASLIDPAATDPMVPRLPAEHPFLDIQPAAYCSATLFADEPALP
jgi:hypothetical protein